MVRGRPIVGEETKGGRDNKEDTVGEDNWRETRGGYHWLQGAKWYIEEMEAEKTFDPRVVKGRHRRWERGEFRRPLTGRWDWVRMDVW